MAHSMAFHIESAPNGAGRIVWDGESAHAASDLLVLPQSKKEHSALEVAKEFLWNLLADGDQLAEVVFREAEQEGISTSTLNRAKSALGVKSDRQNFGAAGEWRWYIPDALKIGKKEL